MKYRRLPGRRSGLLYGATLWMADDHILAVKSLRFREEYKRFYLRDIQAVVVARHARFPVSTGAAGVALLWLVLWIAARNRAPWAPEVMVAAGVALLCAWLFVSVFRSCSCRIYTAVSQDNLPSLHRTWTARRFLAEVEPLIEKVQGRLPGDWAEAVEERTVGPRAAPGVSAALARNAGLRTKAAALRRRTLASQAFIVSLLADAALNLATLHSLTPLVEASFYGLAFIEIGSTIVIFVQHHRGILSGGIQKVAIAALILTGALFYARQMTTGVAMGNRPFLLDPGVLAGLPGYQVLRQVDAGICLVLGLVGLGLAIVPNSEAPNSEAP